MTPGAITAWRKGESSPTQKNLEATVKFLGLTMVEFYGELPKTKRTRAAA